MDIGEWNKIVLLQFSFFFPQISTSHTFYSPLFLYFVHACSQYTLHFQRFIEIPPETNILEYNNPKNAFMKVTINLLGCRANELSTNSQQMIQKTGEAASKCLELNCTSEFKQYFFCVPPTPGTPSPTKSGESLTDIHTWIHGINRATMPRHTFQRYEVTLKANVAPLISDNPIKELDKTVYSPTGYREPFFSSWLTVSFFVFLFFVFCFCKHTCFSNLHSWLPSNIYTCQSYIYYFFMGLFFFFFIQTHTFLQS